MVDARLMRGEDWVVCCICFTIHHRKGPDWAGDEPYPFLFRDAEGDIHDVCKVECAAEAGLV